MKEKDGLTAKQIENLQFVIAMEKNENVTYAVVEYWNGYIRGVEGAY